MPTISDLKQSKFLTKSDVTPPVLATIRGYEQLNVAKEGAPVEEKYVLHFNQFEKPLVLNSTNGQIIASITKSEDFDGWVGKTIVLYFDPNVSFGGKLTGGIRVRAPKEGAKIPTAPSEPVDDGSDAPF
jgi:hypothetical protein